MVLLCHRLLDGRRHAEDQNHFADNPKYQMRALCRYAGRNIAIRILEASKLEVVKRVLNITGDNGSDGTNAIVQLFQLENIFFAY